MTDYPTKPIINGSKAKLSWQNIFGKTIIVELDTAQVINKPILPTGRNTGKSGLTPIIIHHSDNLIPVPLLPIVMRFFGFSEPLLVQGTDGQQYIVSAAEADFIEHACKVLMQYGETLVQKEQ
jgi:hypothetical protein